MARLPPFSIDTSGFQQANSLTLRGAENAAQGDAALGAGIGAGLGAVGQGLANRRQRQETNRRRQEELDYRRGRDERGDLESDRAYELRRLEGAAKLLDDDLTAAELGYQTAQFAAAADPSAILSPEFQEAEMRYQDALSRRRSVQAQAEALLNQPVAATPATHRHTSACRNGRCQQQGVSLHAPKAAPAAPQREVAAPRALPQLDRSDPYVQQALGEARQRMATGGFKGKGVSAALEWAAARRDELMAEGQIKIAGERREAEAKRMEQLRETGARTEESLEFSQELAGIEGLPENVRGSLIREYVSGTGERSVDKDRIRRAAQGYRGSTAATRDAEKEALRAENEQYRRDESARKEGEVKAAKEETRRYRAMETARKIMVPPKDEWAKGQDARNAGHASRLQQLRNMGDELAVAYEALEDNDQNKAARAMMVEAAGGVPQRRDPAPAGPSIGGPPARGVADAPPAAQDEIASRRQRWESWKASNPGADEATRKKMAAHFAAGGA